jgi:SAM-dependent methyltransferase
MSGPDRVVAMSMRDPWETGDAYEAYMGRWSRLVASRFVDWLAAPTGLNWLDVGCGSGALSEAIVTKSRPTHLIAIDQSDGFVRTAQRKLGERACCKVADALALPLADSSVDVAVSGLVLNFLPVPGKALAEMARVTAPGGTVAVYLWDYAGTMEFLRVFWDTVVELFPDASDRHESVRFPESNAEALERLLTHAGLADVETAPIEIPTHFRNLDDYWEPFLGGQGPGPSFVASLDEPARKRLLTALTTRLPTQPDGSIPLSARAWAAKGRVGGEVLGNEKPSPS